jgi:hypothetical protein
MPTLNYENIGAVMEYDYLQGTITALYPEDDTVDLSGLCGVLSRVPVFYHCKPDSVARSNGALTGAVGGFKVSDLVVVLKTSERARSDLYDLNKIELKGSESTVMGPGYFVVGHYDGVRKCSGGELVLILTNGGYLVWNVEKDEIEPIVDDDGNIITGKFSSEIFTTKLIKWRLTKAWMNHSKGALNLGDWFHYTDSHPQFWGQYGNTLSPSLPLYVPSKLGSLDLDNVVDSNEYNSYGCDETYLIGYSVEGSPPVVFNCVCGTRVHTGEEHQDSGAENHNTAWYAQNLLPATAPVNINRQISPAGGVSQNRVVSEDSGCMGGNKTGYNVQQSAGYEEFMINTIQDWVRPDGVILKTPPGKYDVITQSSQTTTSSQEVELVKGPTIWESYACTSGDACTGDRTQNDYLKAGDVEIDETKDKSSPITPFGPIGSQPSFSKQTIKTERYIGTNPPEFDGYDEVITYDPSQSVRSYGYFADVLRSAFVSRKSIFQLYSNTYDGAVIAQSIWVPKQEVKETLGIDPTHFGRNSKLESAVGISKFTSAVLYVDRFPSVTLVDIINDVRLMNNLSVLEEGGWPTSSSEEQIRFFLAAGRCQHTNPDGSPLTFAGGEVLSIGLENVPLTEIVIGWMNSPAHKTVLLGSSWHYAGSASGMYPNNFTQITLGPGMYNSVSKSYTTAETTYDIPPEYRGRVKVYIVRFTP